MRQEITGAAGGSRAVKTKIIRTHMLQEAAGKQEQRRKEIEAKRLQQTEVENNRRKKPKEVKHLEYTRARKQVALPVRMFHTFSFKPTMSQHASL